MTALQFKTRDLFAATFWLAVFAWCVAVMGVKDPIFIAVVVFTVLFSSVVVASSGGRHGRAIWTWLSVIATLFFGFLLPWGPLVQSLFVGTALHLVGGLSLLRGDRALKHRLYLTAGCSLPAFVILAAFHVHANRELAALRREYPLQSLRARLDYEYRPARPLRPHAPVAVSLSPVVDENLEKLEEAVFRSRRRRQLRAIHEWTAADFVSAQGFGVMRVLPPRKDRIERPPLADLPFSGSPRGKGGGWQGYRYAPNDEPLGRLHWLSAFDFFDADGLGYVRAGPLAAGFIPHAFHHEPEQMIGGSDELSAAQYGVDRVELVSLLKHDRPVVYVTNHLPRMDRLAADDVPLRELDAFEADALAQLGEKQDIVTLEQQDHIRMLGALRAARQCLECHDGERGELLGAFTYVITAVE